MRHKCIFKPEIVPVSGCGSGRGTTGCGLCLARGLRGQPHHYPHRTHQGSLPAVWHDLLSSETSATLSGHLTPTDKIKKNIAPVKDSSSASWTPQYEDLMQPLSHDDYLQRGHYFFIHPSIHSLIYFVYSSIVVLSILLLWSIIDAFTSLFFLFLLT